MSVTTKLCLVLVAVLSPIACDPKPVVVPGYFTAKRPANAPPTCEETLACYDRCVPGLEECLLLCDQCGVSREVSRARAVENCAALMGCTDRECIEQRCTSELATCKARYVGGPPVIDTFCPDR